MLRHVRNKYSDKMGANLQVREALKLLVSGLSLVCLFPHPSSSDLHETKRKNNEVYVFLTK